MTHYQHFKNLATSKKLSTNEKIGFSKEARDNLEKYILQDVCTKLPLDSTRNKVVLDIGCGCGNLLYEFMELCASNEHTLILVDSEEMLAQVPDHSNIVKVPGKFPSNLGAILSHYTKVDYIICYSVIQYVFADQSIYKFIDDMVSILNENGRALIGDVPNISMRKRFFLSDNGIKFHQRYTRSNTAPEIDLLKVEKDQIDDAVIMSILHRVRAAGLQSYLLPQSENLFYNNRREDILIHKF